MIIRRRVSSMNEYFTALKKSGIKIRDKIVGDKRANNGTEICFEDDDSEEESSPRMRSLSESLLSRNQNLFENFDFDKD